MSRVAIITGASKGVGLEFAKRLAPKFSALVLTGRDEQGLSDVKDELEGRGHRIVTYIGDMTSASAPQEIIALADSVGGADVLVNNAGIVEYAPFLETSKDMLRRLLAVDVESVYYMSQAFATSVRSRDVPGVIVNLGTVHSLSGVGGTSAYAAAKGAIHALTRSLAVELAPDRIRVNNLVLGTTMTERVKTNLSASLLEQRLQQIPLKRGATPQEAAEALEYLIGAEFMTGEELVLDGGFVMFGDK